MWVDSTAIIRKTVHSPLFTEQKCGCQRGERTPKGPLVALQRPEPESGALAVGQYHDILLTCEGQHPGSTLRVLLHHTAGACWVLNSQVLWSAVSIFTFNDFVKTNLFFTVHFFFFSFFFGFVLELGINKPDSMVHTYHICPIFL